MDKNSLKNFLCQNLGTKKCYKKHEIIFNRGTPTTSIYYIANGAVALSITDGFHKRQILDFKFKGSLLGYSCQKIHNTDCSALSSTEIISYPLEEFQRRTIENPEYAKLETILLSEDISRSRSHAFVLGQYSAIQAITAFLLDLYTCIADEGTTSMALPISRSNIADYLGLTIATVSRNFSLLKQKKLVNFDNSYELEFLNLSGLKELLEQTPTIPSL